MAKERIKNVTIPIYNQETLDRLMQHFPEAYSREETLSRLLDAYDQKDDQQDTALLVQKLFALLPTDYHEDPANGLPRGFYGRAKPYYGRGTFYYGFAK